MAIDLINRCRTAAGAYRTNAEPHIGSTVDLSARDVMSYAALLDEAAAELERMRSERPYIIGFNDGWEAAKEPDVPGDDLPFTTVSKDRADG